MGNAGAESTVALLPGKMATLRKFSRIAGEATLPGFLPPMQMRPYVRGRRRIAFSQVKKSSGSGYFRKRQRRFQSVNAYLYTGQTN
jgi:hypothetical protein